MTSHSNPSSSTEAVPATVPRRYTVIPQPSIVLPTSYADAVLLHVLATKPETIIPPGKSLRAALLRIDTTGNQQSDEAASQSLQSAVEKIVHRAFWDEARESLSDAETSCQISRLRLLYKDLHTALEGLLPNSHPSYVALSNPLSPTPAPLLSARRHLLELTSALQERCAPARDAQISSIRALLEDEGPDGLPDKLVQAIRQLLNIAEMMKKDLSNAILGAVNDEDLEIEVLRIARVEERRAILEIYGAKGIKNRWNAWLASEEVEVDSIDCRWIRRLTKALGADVAITCPLPVPNESESNETRLQPSSDRSETNEVPPVFALSSPNLFHIQNRIQALVITAVLRIIVPVIHTHHVASGTPSNTFTQASEAPQERTEETSSFTDRILSLLMIEVDEETEDAGTTKLVNLADEVVREYRRLKASNKTPSHANDSSVTQENSELPPIDEQAIRSQVDALLKPRNSVLALLRNRLLATLTECLVSLIRSDMQEKGKEKTRRIPVSMRTGRERERDAKRPRLNLSDASSTDLHLHDKGRLRRISQDLVRAGKVNTKGYEDPALLKGIGDLLAEVSDVVEWVRDTWGGLGLELEGLDQVEPKIEQQGQESSAEEQEKDQEAGNS